MSILTLTASRFGTKFEPKTWAYVVADRAVRKLGRLITPVPMVQHVDDNGEITFELTPNVMVDEQVPFKYTVAVFNAETRIIYQHSIVMPITDTNIFDLIDEPVDLDACVQTPLINNGE